MNSFQIGKKITDCVLTSIAHLLLNLVAFLLTWLAPNLRDDNSETFLCCPSLDICRAAGWIKKKKETIATASLDSLFTRNISWVELRPQQLSYWQESDCALSLVDTNSCHFCYWDINIDQVAFPMYYNIILYFIHWKCSVDFFLLQLYDFASRLNLNFDQI